MSNIVSLKLVTGEELVAEITLESENSISLKNPVACVMQRRQDGPALGFVPWMQAANGPTFVLEKNKIVCQAEVADEVKNGYNQIFGAGIMVPPKDLILG